MTKFRKQIWFAFGIVCVGLGFVGFAVPGLPGILFMCLAAWAFSKCSERWRNWVLTHPKFGAAVQNWASERSLSHKMKIGISLSMIPTAFVMAFAIQSLGLQIACGVGMAIVLIYIWTRPMPKTPT